MGLLNGDVWLRNARVANDAAKQLTERLQNETKIDIMFPVEANAVFLRMDKELVRDLYERGWSFYKFIEPDIYRVMCSWSVTNEDVTEFVGDVKTLRPR